MRARRRRLTESTSSTRLASLCLLALAGLFNLCGCSSLGEDFAYTKLAGPYSQTRLMASSTLDVLALSESPAYQFAPEAIGKQLLNQSDAMVALSGQSADGLKTWVNLIAFDERHMTARRKYFFCSDENAAGAVTDHVTNLIARRKGLLFDGQLVLSPTIRTTPYATEEARRIAIVQWLAEQFNQDVRALTGREDRSVHADELVSLAGMMMNQTFGGALVALGKSPGLARSLSDAEGVEFPHISLNHGRIRLSATNDVVTVRIRVNLPMATPQP